MNRPLAQNVSNRELPYFGGEETKVTQASADAVSTKRLKLDKAVKNLGLLARPHGDIINIMKIVKGRPRDCTTKVEAGYIPTRLVWEKAHTVTIGRNEVRSSSRLVTRIQLL